MCATGAIPLLAQLWIKECAAKKMEAAVACTRFLINRRTSRPPSCANPCKISGAHTNKRPAERTLVLSAVSAKKLGGNGFFFSCRPHIPAGRSRT